MRRTLATFACLLMIVFSLPLQAQTGAAEPATPSQYGTSGQQHGQPVDQPGSATNPQPYEGQIGTSGMQAPGYEADDDRGGFNAGWLGLVGLVGLLGLRRRRRETTVTR